MPAYSACPRCGHTRTPLDSPHAPGQACWRAHVPGAVAARLTWVLFETAIALVVPWGYISQESAQYDGGVTLIDLDSGKELWTTRLGKPVEGGAATAQRKKSRWYERFKPDRDIQAGCIIVGTSLPGIGAGQGELVVLDLNTGEKRWQIPVGGAIRGAPVIDDLRVYTAANDGRLYCFDLRDGKPVWRTPPQVFDGPTQIRASPLIVREQGKLQAIIIATYGSASRRLSGRIVALDEKGCLLWSKDAGGNVRGTPVAAHGRVYVSAYREYPPTGILAAFDLRTGEPVWPQPFVTTPSPDVTQPSYFAASPLVQGRTLYVGSLDHHLYALDAESGRVRWTVELGGGIPTTPAWAEGLIVVCCNDGRVYGVDPEARRVVWTIEVGAPLLTDPLVIQGAVFTGDSEGEVVALPWHMGEYLWAAQWLELAGRHSESGDCYALAAHHCASGDEQERLYRTAETEWGKAGEPEKAAEMWLALDRLLEAARAFQRAGDLWRNRDVERAIWYYARAADLFYLLRKGEELNACNHALATCAGSPFVVLRTVNVPTFVEWEPGELTLRLLNLGTAAIPHGVRLRIGGSLKNWIQLEIPEPFPGRTEWNIPLQITATQRDSLLELELEYDSGMPRLGLLRQLYSVPIRAVESKQPPTLVVGDVGYLRVDVHTSTIEGLRITTRDIGVARVVVPQERAELPDSGWPDAAAEEGARQSIPEPRKEIELSDTAKCPSCGKALQEIGQRFCEYCGAYLGRDGA